MSGETYEHEPVLLTEVLAWLRPSRCGGLFFDGTLGGGGHAAALLAAHPSVRVLGMDRDPEARAAAGRRLAVFGDRVRICAGDFREAGRALEDVAGGEGLEGALLDLGVSSHQIDRTARGFSFRRSTPLDMRMGGTTGGRRTAADLLAEASEEELGRIFRDYGEERAWRRVARSIVRRRSRRPLRTSDDLVGALEAALGTGLTMRDKARLFQAVRIAVNDELTALEEGLDAIREGLAPGGRIVVIAYHSLEDRIVKRTFRDWSRSCICPPELPECRCRGAALGTTLTKRPVRPTAEEAASNVRARSARLRAWEAR
ncbi:MAG: 16S rRNA (cytosine(1402)-N(4))-methyltransferase RsmH [Gemmatimonadota bacterium]